MNRARQTSTTVSRLRKAATFERFLARLVDVSDQWVMKGALALDFRFAEGTRSTLDGDLLYSSDAESAKEGVLAAAELVVPDGFVFFVSGFETSDAGSLRFRIAADIAGRLFEEIILDVSFADPVIGEVERVMGPDYLAFAGVSPPSIPLLPLEQQAAEKVHAYTRRYGSTSEPSSRPKDLIDLVIIGRSGRTDPDRLRHVLELTFARRDTHPLPERLPRPPGDWEVPYNRMAEEVGLTGGLEAGYEEARAFIDPLLAPPPAPWP